MARRKESRRQFLRRASTSAGMLAVGLGGATALNLAPERPAQADEGPPKMIGIVAIHNMGMRAGDPLASFIDGLESDGLVQGRDFVPLPLYADWSKGRARTNAGAHNTNPNIQAIVLLDSLSNAALTEKPPMITAKPVMVA